MTLSTERIESELQGGLRSLLQRADWILGLCVVGLLLVLIIPINSFLLDILLAFNITVGVMILLVCANSRSPLEFSTFPSILLFVTLLRLGLNVASTRLILLEGKAGEVIRAFGEFVVGGQLVVGLVVFLILVVIQFVVITKGATRISEVAARFTLDAMPGKQMSIDADLNAGLIDQKEANERREKIASEAEFHGAMDGAAKFVRGDALAGLIITAINLLGGLIRGVLSGSGLKEALDTYALLTVGDGLASQIPALMISVAAGVITTKTASKAVLAKEISTQFLGKPRAIGTAAVAVFIVGLFPGMPKMPFLILTVLLFFLYRATRHLEGVEKKDEEVKEKQREARLKALSGSGEEGGPGEGGARPANKSAEVKDLLGVDRLSVEIGVRLIDIVEDKAGTGLLDHIRNLRRQFAMQSGLIVPPVRIKDNMRLDPKEYRILFGGNEVARGKLEPGWFLAIRPNGNLDDIEGSPTTDPTFGLPAKWVRPEMRDQADFLGYSTVDAVSVLVTHLTEIIRETAHELLTRDDVRLMIDTVKERAPAVVDELVGALLSLGEIQKVLRNLLRERVSIRNLPLILEALCDHAVETKDTELLTELVRRRLGSTIALDVQDESGIIWAVTLEPSVEERLVQAMSRDGEPVDVGPRFLHELVQGVKQALEEAAVRGREAVLLVRPNVRRFMRDLLEKDLPRLPVLSFTEIQNARHVEPVAMAGTPAPAGAAAGVEMRV